MGVSDMKSLSGERHRTDFTHRRASLGELDSDCGFIVSPFCFVFLGGALCLDFIFSSFRSDRVYFLKSDVASEDLLFLDAGSPAAAALLLGEAQTRRGLCGPPGQVQHQ